VGDKKGQLHLFSPNLTLYNQKQVGTVSKWEARWKVSLVTPISSLRTSLKHF